MGEFIGLVVLGLFLVGPDKLPEATRDFARMVHRIRGLTSEASKELKKNLGPGFEDLDVKDLNPKNLAKKVLGDALEDTKPTIEEARKRSKELKEIAKIDPDLL